jgi:hypothetical protein
MPLKAVLQGLLESVAFADGKPVQSKLAKGLTIRLKRQDDLVLVQLSREDVIPSKAEWKAVIDCWPSQVTVIEEPRELLPQGKRQFLRGKLRQSPRLVG